MSSQEKKYEFSGVKQFPIIHNQKNDKREGDNRLIEKLRDFSENTTAHGVKRILIASNAWTGRLWSLWIFICFIILIVQAHHLVMKFNRYEKITSIELRFDQMRFPAITFCNLNPYKKSLVKLVPSVKDTMDVYENAKHLNKESGLKEIKVNPSINEERVRILFEAENADEKIRENSFTKQTSEWYDDSSGYSDIESYYHERSRRDVDERNFNAMKAHCKCIGENDMECIRFDTPPITEHGICICSYDFVKKDAWPCYNITDWYITKCPICFENGKCEVESDIPVEKYEDIACICKDKHTFLKPLCLKHSIPLPNLWDYLRSETSTTTLSETSTTTRTPHRNQSSRATAPETVKAMGFTGMTDGVAMLTRAKENLLYTMSALSVEQRIALSHSKKELIEMCSFNGKECNITEDFKLHVDPEFGNCYTFNWNPNNNYTSSKAGPMYGIRVLLFIDLDDYMATSESAGVRLAVHNPSEFPFPDTFGYSAPAGFASSFGLRKHMVKRLAAPYGDCETKSKMDSSNYIYGDYDYDPEGCHRSCFQNLLLRKCGCGDPRFPVPVGEKHCSAFDANARYCVENAIAEMGDFHHISDSHDCLCKQSCVHEVYSASFSTAKWPSGASDLGNCDHLTSQECEEYYRKNAAMVEVYYEQLNYEMLKESEAYGVVNLLADVGGHLGLWLGFSVITIIECAVLLLDLMTACFAKRKLKMESRQQIHRSQQNNERIFNISNSESIEETSKEKTFRI